MGSGFPVRELGGERRRGNLAPRRLARVSREQGRALKQTGNRVRASTARSRSGKRKKVATDEDRKPSLAESVYLGIKQDIFDFRLLPGDRFTENEVAGRLKVSRTPAREALYRLEREGYLHVHFRNGWSV